MGGKRAEREFLQRSGSLDWERHKPFSLPGHWTCPNSIDLIQEFVVAVKQLHPSPDDIILDLGAGSCWASEWMQRLNIRTISVDISLDAIRAGRDRMRDGSLLAVGDMEKLPFRDAACTKILSLDALHHSQDIARTVREVYRVLKPGGCAVFVEPGEGHAEAPETRVSVENFGLTERSIGVSELFGLCSTVGFAEIRLRPISYIIPEFEMTSREWQAWERFWLRKRPVRGLQKIGRALLEMLGLAKKTLLLEETFAVELVRLFKNPVQGRPVVVAWKEYRPEIELPVFSAGIKIEQRPERVSPGQQCTIGVSTQNTGNFCWTDRAAGQVGAVQLGIQLLDAEKRMLDKDYVRHRLARPIAPGQSEVMEVQVRIPEGPGNYFLKADMVAEGITWFEQKGSSVDVWRINTQ